MERSRKKETEGSRRKRERRGEKAKAEGRGGRRKGKTVGTDYKVRQKKRGFQGYKNHV